LNAYQNFVWLLYQQVEYSQSFLKWELSTDILFI
jgi:hypothetical protein